MEITTRKLLMPVDVSQLAEMRNQVDQICIQNGLSTVATRRMVLAIDEALSNIIEHGHMDEGETIELTLDISLDEITVMLRDSGIAFDPCSSQRQPQQESYPRRGFGLYLIRLIVDELQYKRSDDGFNVLSLIKRLDQQ